MSEAEREVLRKERIGLEFSDEDTKAKEHLDEKTVGRSRVAMFGIGILGLITAFIAQHLFSLDRLWWIFNGVASCFAVPTVLSLYYDRLSPKGVLYGIIGSLFGMIAFVYGNWVQNDMITVFSAIFIIVISLVCCLTFKRPTAWKSEAVLDTPKGKES